MAIDLNESSTGHAPPTAEEKRVALQQVLQTGALTRAGQLQSFLRFICEMEMAGRGGELSEYRIGVEALGRPDGYSPAEDAAVRRRAIDLREKLDEIYATELAGATLRIDLPKGRYVPRFIRVEPPRTEVAPPSRPADPPARRGYPLVVVVGAFVAGVALTALAFRTLPALQPDTTRVPGIAYEAEASANTLSGTAVREICESCSGGQRVRRIGNAPASHVVMSDIAVPQSGSYALRVDYVLSGSRTFFLSVNGGPGIELPLHGHSWSQPASATVTVRLEAGRNKVKVYNDTAYAPDLDRLVVLAP